MKEEPDITVEPIAGLPGKPPRGEEILWQGRPGTWALARDAMALKWVAGYFILLTLWRVSTLSLDLPLRDALLAGVPSLVSGVLVVLILLIIAWVLARTTAYTITTERVAMRIGAALTVTLNIPFKQLGGAALELRRDGTGSIALQTTGDTRLSYLVCWPHVRPWRMRITEPSLRSIPDADRVARILSDAAETWVSRPSLARLAPAHAPVAAE